MSLTHSRVTSSFFPPPITQSTLYRPDEYEPFSPYRTHTQDGIVCCESSALAEASHVNEAIEKANLISTTGGKDRLLHRIILITLRKDATTDNFDIAIRVTELIQHTEIRAGALNDISIAYTKYGHFRQAIDVANSILNSRIREVAFKSIGTALYKKILVLTKDRKFNEAIEDANSIPTEAINGWAALTKAKALKEIVRVLTEDGNIDTEDYIKQAIAAANLLPAEEARGCALRDICRALIKNGYIHKKGYIDQARAAANLIPDASTKQSTLQEIFTALMQSGNLNMR